MTQDKSKTALNLAYNYGDDHGISNTQGGIIIFEKSLCTFSFKMFSHSKTHQNQCPKIISM